MKKRWYHRRRHHGTAMRTRIKPDSTSLVHPLRSSARLEDAGGRSLTSPRAVAEAVPIIIMSLLSEL